MWFPLEQKLTQKKHYETGVGKIRENINNLKNNVPIRNHLLFTSGAGGGGYYNVTEPLRWGGGERESGKFYWTQQKLPPPLPFLGDKEWTFY